MGKWLFTAALTAATFASAAVAQDRTNPITWDQSPIVVFPGDIESGEMSLNKGDTVFQLPLRWAMSGRLGSDITVMDGKEPVAFDSGSVLPKVRIGGKKGHPVSFAFCTRSRVKEAKEGTGFMGAMFGKMLNSANDKQICLQDSDADGMLDTAITVGDGPGINELGSFAPVAIEELVGEPIVGGDDRLSLVMRGVTKKVVDLELRLVQRGKVRDFDSWVSGPYRASRINLISYAGKRAGPLTIFGMKFEVLDAQRDPDTAKLRLTSNLPSDTFIVVPDEVQQRVY